MLHLIHITMDGKKLLGSPKRQVHEEKGVDHGKKDKGSRSVFYTDESSDEPPNGSTTSQPVVECLKDLKAYMELLHRVSGAGTQLAQQFDALLKDTPYSEIAGQFYSGMTDIDEQTKLKHSQIISETDTDIECLACETQPGKAARSDIGLSEGSSEVCVSLRPFYPVFIFQYFQTFNTHSCA